MKFSTQWPTPPPATQLVYPKTTSCYRASCSGNVVLTWFQNNPNSRSVVPNWLQNGSKMEQKCHLGPPKWLMTAPGALDGANRPPKMAPGGIQEAFGGLQEAPRDPQRLPKDGNYSRKKKDRICTNTLTPKSAQPCQQGEHYGQKTPSHEKKTKNEGARRHEQFYSQAVSDFAVTFWEAPAGSVCGVQMQ